MQLIKTILLSGFMLFFNARVKAQSLLGFVQLQEHTIFSHNELKVLFMLLYNKVFGLKRETNSYVEVYLFTKGIEYIR